MNNKIGTYIVFLRKKKGWTQVALGEVIGVSDKTISRWENGESYPDLTILPKLAQALETSTDSILNGEPIGIKQSLESIRSKKDIAKFKYIAMCSLGMVLQIIALKCLIDYIMMNEIKINFVRDILSYNYADMPPFTMSGYEALNEGAEYIGTYLTTGLLITVLALTFFSFVITRYGKKYSEQEGYNFDFPFFNAVMNCLYVAPILFLGISSVSPFLPLEIYVHSTTISIILWFLYCGYKMFKLFNLEDSLSIESK